jgi:glutamate synthase domain-containing protein 3
VILLGLGGTLHSQNFIGSGMHGGVIYIRGKVNRLSVADQVEISQPGVDDLKVLDQYVGEFVERFPEMRLSKQEILNGEFVRLAPKSKRPYAKMYA